MGQRSEQGHLRNAGETRALSWRVEVGEEPGKAPELGKGALTGAPEGEDRAGEPKQGPGGPREGLAAGKEGALRVKWRRGWERG